MTMDSQFDSELRHKWDDAMSRGHFLINNRSHIQRVLNAAVFAWWCITVIRTSVVCWRSLTMLSEASGMMQWIEDISAINSVTCRQESFRAITTSYFRFNCQLLFDTSMCVWLTYLDLVPPVLVGTLGNEIPPSLAVVGYSLYHSLANSVLQVWVLFLHWTDLVCLYTFDCFSASSS